MINNDTIRHKLNLISDALVDVAEDIKLSDQLSSIAFCLIQQAEAYSHIADSFKDEHTQPD